MDADLRNDAGAWWPDASESSGALCGVRVVDLSRVLAGPLCTQMLADHGASVIKVEPPFGDETRQLGPPFDAQGTAAYFAAVNRGKRGISLDLANAADRALLLRLLDDADVLVENFRPGTMEKWDLGYETHLAERFPRLVYCRISGFGATGPMGGMPGYDAVLQAMCGLMSINGSPQTGPTRIGIPVVDHVTAYTAFSGILMALFARARSGQGQCVEATLFDTALSLLVPHAMNWLHSGDTPGLLGSAHPNIAPYDKFQARDGLVFLGILNDVQFARFAACMERPDLPEHAAFRNNAARLANRDTLKREIEALFAPWDRRPLCDMLMAHGIPAGPVHSVPEAFGQPHARHRHMLVARDDYQGLGIPIRLHGTPGRPGRAPPAFAQHADIRTRLAAAVSADTG